MHCENYIVLLLCALMRHYGVVMSQGNNNNYELTCGQGEAGLVLKNVDGKLKYSCQPFGKCENLDTFQPTCSSLWVRQCNPLSQYLWGIRLEKYEEIGSFGYPVTKSRYLMRCCTHLGIPKNFIARRDVKLDGASAANEAVTGTWNDQTADLISNAITNEREVESYTAVVSTVRCKDPSTSTVTVTVTPRPQPHNGQNGGGGGGSNDNQEPEETDNSGPRTSNCAEQFTLESLKSQATRLQREGKSVKVLGNELCSTDIARCSSNCQELLAAKFLQGMCIPNPETNCQQSACVCISRDDTQQNDQHQPQQQPAAAAPLGCFAAESEVNTRQGPKKMRDLKTHDEVLVTLTGGNVAWQRVVWFLHREPETHATFLNIKTSEGQLISLTPYHLLPVVPSCDPSVLHEADYESVIQKYSVFAQRAQVGHCVLTHQNKQTRMVPIVTIEQSENTGVYAPVTTSGQIVVGNVVASCFSHVENHLLQRSLFWLYHTVTQSVAQIAQWYNGEFGSTDVSQVPYLVSLFGELTKLL